MNGYKSNFLGPTYEVGFPDYRIYRTDIAKNQQTDGDILDYIYYSVVQSRSRRLPIFSASNIYRTEFTPVERAGSFKQDERINDFEQLTTNDYKQFNTIKAAALEKGHMTKREDVQWDENDDNEKAEEAARSTFYYPNASPQHDRLNNGVWKLLENSIIIKGRVPKPARVSVFTGPVLDSDDPLMKANLHDGSPFRIPILFWKIVYYVKEDGNLYYAAFIMGQVNPLKEDNLIIEEEAKGLDKPPKALKPFLTFEEDEKYQVPVSLVEELTLLKFTEANDLHKDNPPVKLSTVQIKGDMDEELITMVEGINV